MADSSASIGLSRHQLSGIPTRITPPLLGCLACCFIHFQWVTKPPSGLVVVLRNSSSTFALPILFVFPIMCYDGSATTVACCNHIFAPVP